MLGLVLGGGGAKGSYEIGVWKALRELDVDIQVVTGTSIGSLNAAFVAQGDFQKAVDAWYNFDAGKMFGIENYNKLDLAEKTKQSLLMLGKEIYKYGGSEITEYRNTIEKYVNEESVRNSKIKMGLVTVKLEKFKSVELSIDEIKKGKLVDYIMASSSIAIAIKPQEINGEKYIDGGHIENIPIDLAKRLGADEFIVVDLGSLSSGTKIKKSDKNKNIKLIKSYWDLGNMVVFDKENVTKNMQLGYFDTLKKFDVLYGNAYTFKKENYSNDYLEKLDAFFGDDYKQKLDLKLISKIVESNYKRMIQAHNSRGSIYIDDTTSILEILAEILEIDYTKIYSRDGLHKRISEELQKIEISEYKINSISDIKNIFVDIIDLKKVLKYFVECERKDKFEAMNNLKFASMVYDKVLFASLYVILYNLD